MIVVSNILGAAAMFVLVFVHWKKGSELWLRISPYIFGTLLIFAFVIMPFFNVALSVYLIIDSSIALVDQQIESYVVFFQFLYLIRIFEFFTWIRKSIFDDARTWLSSRAVIHNKNVTELE